MSHLLVRFLRFFWKALRRTKINRSDTLPWIQRLFTHSFAWAYFTKWNGQKLPIYCICLICLSGRSAGGILVWMSDESTCEVEWYMSEVPVVLQRRCPFFLHLGWKWSASRPTQRLVQRTDSACLDGFCHCFPGWTLCLFSGTLLCITIGQVCRLSSSRPDGCLQT